MNIIYQIMRVIAVIFTIGVSKNLATAIETAPHVDLMRYIEVNDLIGQCIMCTVLIILTIYIGNRRNT